MASPEMIAAVSAAVKGETPPADPPVDPPAGDPPAGDPPVDPPADPPAGDPPVDPPAGDPPAPIVDDAGRVRGPDGKFAPKPVDPAAAPAAAAPVAPPKPPDPVNDPVPPNAKPETRERITNLANMVKEKDTLIATKDTELQAVQGDLELLLAPIREAGVELPQFKEAMNLMGLLNSPHQHDQLQALQLLQDTVAELSGRLGHVPPGTDPLVGFPDLMAQVQANPALRKVAEDAARGRRLTVASQQHTQQSQQRAQQAQLQQREIQGGQAAVRAVEQALEAANPATYKAKVALMRADAAFMAQFRTLPPSSWATKFAEKFHAVQVAAPAAAPVAGAPGGPSPLRAKQPAGTAAKPPTSMLEAVRGALKVG